MRKVQRRWSHRDAHRDPPSEVERIARSPPSPGRRRKPNPGWRILRIRFAAG